ncbi:MAG TPA: alpha/beta hydrolase [Tepidisphaeraceae bacterium]|jgi:acetyl esterase|nr:alpha/beta hydrolase [Tepidisphaeraceae bacterium]
MRFGRNLVIVASISTAAALMVGCANDAEKPMKSGTQAALSKANPQMTAVLDELKELNPKPVENLSPQQARQQPTPTQAVKQLMQERGMDTSPEPMASVNNRNVTTADGRNVPVRVYTPKTQRQGPLPVLVYAHGGGWVIATLDTYDASCRALAKMADCVVVSVDYRQAPENKFPAAPEDVYGVLQWASKNASEINGDPKRIAIGGESAGGNLATVACLIAKDRGGAMPVHQLLVYPITNNDFSTPSYQANAEAKPLNKAMMQWFFKHYLAANASDAQNKYVSPLKASQGELSGLPPATVITAEIDPLMSDGQQYAEKLRAAGVEITNRNFNGVTHEFFGMGAVIDEAKAAQKFAAERLNTAFNR